MDSKQRKKKGEDVIRYIGKWFCEARIPLNTTTLPSFQQMLITIKKFGYMLDTLTPYELNETFLEREVETKGSLKPFKESCVVSEYVLMADAWSDRNNRSLRNIIAHCAQKITLPQDALVEKHDATYIY